MASIIELVILIALGVWLVFGRSRPAFLRDFARLLDRPEFDSESSNRECLKGEFLDRRVAILLQYHLGRDRDMVVVSMETRATTTMETHDFANWPDRDTEAALYTLEVNHGLKLRHSDGCLKALWQPLAYFWRFPGFFPGPFELTKWQSVLEKMEVVARSIERRAALASLATDES
jgi:hypothetical protein